MEKQILQELQEIKRLLSLHKEVFTLEEFCTYAGLSLNQGYHLTSTRQVPFYRPFGKKIYLRKDDVMDFLLKNPAGTRAAIAKKSVLNTIK
ncbi:DNA binding domain-containing protein, excisionase family [Hydrobacter penzbergensis]|uniref:DNA binding domain-containing protein, excisionase family n=1 Tax=Hydrobacter penzbergensis TaxID=1235997 RepID=A0A8X8IFF5_9BACT|nr:helix-turn-helix domain-containing protein [Hydrobacter penzbergensis]SDW41515.1 DNA binding domain-containing protein, excisionase family [Hydrobacter penzbergensis]